jgi:excisionase family DNA binding protein
MEPLAVDVREAARLTSLSVHTIRLYVNTGRIAATRIGRRVVIPLESLERLVKGKNERPPR